MALLPVPSRLMVLLSKTSRLAAPVSAVPRHVALLSRVSRLALPLTAAAGPVPLLAAAPTVASAVPKSSCATTGERCGEAGGVTGCKAG